MVVHHFPSTCANQPTQFNNRRRGLHSGAARCSGAKWGAMCVCQDGWPCRHVKPSRGISQWLRAPRKLGATQRLLDKLARAHRVQQLVLLGGKWVRVCRGNCRVHALRCRCATTAAAALSGSTALLSYTPWTTRRLRGSAEREHRVYRVARAGEQQQQSALAMASGVAQPQAQRVVIDLGSDSPEAPVRSRTTLQCGRVQRPSLVASVGRLILARRRLPKTGVMRIRSVERYGPAAAARSERSERARKPRSTPECRPRPAPHVVAACTRHRRRH